jgi:flagellar assembly factor FliW
MQLETRQFGVVEVATEDIIQFPKGLLGFEGLERYVIINNPECFPFRWLQSVETSEIAFVIVSPVIFFPRYKVAVHAKEVADIGVSDPQDVEIHVIVTVPPELEHMTANLQGPILINARNKMGKQLVLTNSDYGVQHSIVEQLSSATLKRESYRATAVELT